MRPNPLVSIVTPSFNQAKFLEKAITSVLQQDYPSIEYLVVDGNSTDGSQAIIKKYEDKIHWWISEPDQGQAEAINKGLSRTHGNIVAWLNSDDYYLPGAIKKAVDAFTRNPESAFIYGDVLAVNAAELELNQMRYHQWELVDLMKLTSSVNHLSLSTMKRFPKPDFWIRHFIIFWIISFGCALLKPDLFYIYLNCFLVLIFIHNLRMSPGQVSLVRMLTKLWNGCRQIRRSKSCLLQMQRKSGQERIASMPVICWMAINPGGHSKLISDVWAWIFQQPFQNGTGFFFHW
jgi:glycosyltransferase involved in cell wall biosynthesis